MRFLQRTAKFKINRNERFLAKLFLSNSDMNTPGKNIDMSEKVLNYSDLIELLSHS